MTTTPYIVPADFRPSTLKWWTRETPLDKGTVPDADLTAAIADQSARLDYWTHDHFAAPSYDAITAATAAASVATFTVANTYAIGDFVTVAGVTPAAYNGTWAVLTASPTQFTANIGATPGNGTIFGTATKNEVLSVDGDGTPYLYLPKRIISIAQVVTQPWKGTSTVEDPTVYRVTPSIIAGVRTVEDADIIRIIPWSFLSTGYGIWPPGAATVLVTGLFGWTVTPDSIKRAVAMLVWAHFQYGNPDIRRAVVFPNLQGTVGGSGAGSVSTMMSTTPSGIPEVDQIVAEYTRDAPYF